MGGLDTGAFGGDFTFGQTAQAINTLAPKFQEDFDKTSKQLPDSIRAVTSALQEMGAALGKIGLADKLNDTARYLRNFGGGLDYLKDHGFRESAKVLGDDFSNRVAPYIPNREDVIKPGSIADVMLPKTQDFEDFAALPGKIVAAIADFDTRLKEKGSSWLELLTGLQAAPEGPVPQRATGISPTSQTLEPGQWRGGIVAALAGGGPIVGPGTGTSDSITMNAGVGDFILKESAARRAGRRALDQLHGLAAGGRVPIRVSNGEEYFPRTEVDRIGLPALRSLNGMDRGGEIAKLLGLPGHADGDQVNPYGRPLQPGDPGFSRPLQPGDLYYPHPIGPGESGYAVPGTANITRGRGYGEAQSEADFAAYAAFQGRAEAVLGTERNKEAGAQLARGLAYGKYQQRWLSSRLGEHSAGDAGAARARIFGGDPGPSQGMENLIPGHGLDLRNVFQYRDGGYVPPKFDTGADVDRFADIFAPSGASIPSIHDVDQSRFADIFAPSGMSIPSIDSGGVDLSSLRNSLSPSIAPPRIAEASAGSELKHVMDYRFNGETVAEGRVDEEFVRSAKRTAVRDRSRRAGRSSPWVGS